MPETRDEKLEAQVLAILDSAMRLGACLGDWGRPSDSTSFSYAQQAANAAFKAVQEVLFDEIKALFKNVDKYDVSKLEQMSLETVKKFLSDKGETP